MSGAPNAATTWPTLLNGRKFVKTPSATRAASRSIGSRSAASTIGTGCAGGAASLKPPSPRSPASTARRYATVSSTRFSGRSNGMPFQRSTITFDDAPRPSTKRPPLASASAAAVCASRAGPRVKTLTIPVTRRTRSVCSAAITSGVNPS